METKRIIVGSQAFFNCYDDFKPHDTDILILEDNPIDYKVCCQIRLKDNCYFKWKRLSPKEYIDWHKNCKCGMFIGKFLVKEFVDEIGFTIEDLKQLQHLVDKLDKKHSYEKIIYDAYITNNAFELTDAQRLEAYKCYNLYHNSTEK